MGGGERSPEWPQQASCSCWKRELNPVAKLGCSAENAPPITLLRALGSGGIYTPAPHSHWLRAAPRQVRHSGAQAKWAPEARESPQGPRCRCGAFCGWGSSWRDLKRPVQGDSQDGTRTAGLTASLPANPDPFSPQHRHSDLRRAPLPPAFPPLCTPQPERPTQNQSCHFRAQSTFRTIKVPALAPT